MVEKDQSSGEPNLPPVNPDWLWGDELKAKEKPGEEGSKPAAEPESAVADGETYTNVTELLADERQANIRRLERLDKHFKTHRPDDKNH